MNTAPTPRLIAGMSREARPHEFQLLTTHPLQIEETITIRMIDGYTAAIEVLGPHHQPFLFLISRDETHYICTVNFGFEGTEGKVTPRTILEMPVTPINVLRQTRQKIGIVQAADMFHCGVPEVELRQRHRLRLNTEPLHITAEEADGFYRDLVYHLYRY